MNARIWNAPTRNSRVDVEDSPHYSDNFWLIAFVQNDAMFDGLISIDKQRITNPELLRLTIYNLKDNIQYLWKPWTFFQKINVQQTVINVRNFRRKRNSNPQCFSKMHSQCKLVRPTTIWEKEKETYFKACWNPAGLNLRTSTFLSNRNKPIEQLFLIGSPEYYAC